MLSRLSFCRIWSLSRKSSHIVRCINTGESQSQAKVATVAKEEEIIVPKAINRSPTAVLETLSSLVGRVRLLFSFSICDHKVLSIIVFVFCFRIQQRHIINMLMIHTLFQCQMQLNEHMH